MKAGRFGLLLFSAVIVIAPSILVCKYESALASSSSQASLAASHDRDWTIHYSPRETTGVKRAKLEPETGAYLGAYVLQDDSIGQSMERFNQLTGRDHASFFKYVGYGQPFPVKWVRDVAAAGAFPHIAWEPNNGLDEVRDDAYLREFAAQAHDADVPILLRFASEMNGTWTSYSGNPELYKEKWRLVHDVFEEVSPNTAMLWSVLAMPEKPMADYYPGDELVDWVGVNIYSVRYHNGDRSYPADREDPLDLLNAVYDRFSRTKLIAVSEFGASHYTTTDGKRDIGFAAQKIRRLYGALEDRYPRVKAVYYFDVNNISAFNPSRRVNDYSITGEQALLDAYGEATASNYFAGHIASAAGVKGNNQHGESHRESYTFRGKLFESKGVLYADESFFTDYLGIKLTRISKDANGSEIVSAERRIGEDSTTVTARLVKRSIKAGYTNPHGAQVMRKLRAIAVLETIRALGYQAVVDDTDIWIEE
ncbi:glycosyl hydrolase [Paenibacillus sp. LHD-117]|uniref:glycoside hydrolase family 26 protein n=1 Tax=Paenibacillus sp. LHD-117 TaxID=3071412 RepID=UPI0027E149D1|nr:glycosyl hydrolase [Paenibacillus sp. LHD-117]MDQ6420069.1 glycosyl hydrolase [Paenibacillus sp. LHD-117]